MLTSPRSHSHVCAKVIPPATVTVSPRHSVDHCILLQTDDKHPPSLQAHHLEADFYRPNLKSQVGFTRNVISVSFPMTRVKAKISSCSTSLVILSHECFALELDSIPWSLRTWAVWHFRAFTSVLTSAVGRHFHARLSSTVPSLTSRFLADSTVFSQV